MNNHFASYHIYDLIQRYGPLRYYSCRSLERTIQKFTNLCRSTSATNTESNNVMQRTNYFKTYKAQLNLEGLVPVRRTRIDEFEDHPNDIDGTMPQLWEKFEVCYLEQNKMIANVPMSQIEDAMKKYFGRMPGGVASLDNNRIKLAARIVKDSTVIQSRWHRLNQKNVKRANNLVIVQAKESVR